jgi:hypothetical protein
LTEKTFEIQLFDPKWTLPSFAEKNARAWMATLSGLVIDLQDTPREVQEIAFEDGWIPHSSGSERPIVNATVAEEAK